MHMVIPDRNVCGCEREREREKGRERERKGERLQKVDRPLTLTSTDTPPLKKTEGTSSIHSCIQSIQFVHPLIHSILSTSVHLLSTSCPPPVHTFRRRTVLLSWSSAPRGIHSPPIPPDPSPARYAPGAPLIGCL